MLQSFQAKDFSLLQWLKIAKRPSLMMFSKNTRYALDLILAQYCSVTLNYSFKLLGRCLARALKDSRMLDLPISNLMARALLNEEDYFQFNDLQSLDSQLHRSLQQLKSFIHTNQTDSVEGILFSIFQKSCVFTYT